MQWTDGDPSNVDLGYQVYRSSTGDAGTFTLLAQATGISFDDPVMPGITYTYQVREIEPQGTSLASNSATAATPADPVPNTPGGLRGTYFNKGGGFQFSTVPVLSRIDEPIDFDFGSGSPDPVVNSDNFSIRWTGQVIADVAGQYTFVGNSDDGHNLYVDGKLVSTDPGNHTQRDATNLTPINLSAGNHDIRFEVYEVAGDAGAHLKWITPGNSVTTIIPADHLIPRASLPSSPTNGSIVGGAPVFQLSWKDISGSELQYIVERAMMLTFSDKRELAVLGPDATAATDPSFVNCSPSPRYRVRGVNYDGFGSYSLQIVPKVITVDCPPPDPTDLVASAGPGVIHLAWQSLGQTPTKFEIERKSGIVAFAKIGEAAGSARSFDDSDPAVVNGTTYTYRVRAVSPGGFSKYSGEVSATAFNPRAKPADPTNPNTSLIICTKSVTIAWTDNATTETGYSIERSADPDTGFVQIGTTGPDAQAFVDPGPLLPNTVYYYRVRAVDSNNIPANQFSNYTTVVSASGPGPVNIPSFEDDPDAVLLLGDATINTSLQLTDAQNNQLGGAYLASPQWIDGFWNVTFDFEIQAGDGAEGFTFVMQSISPTALGSGASGLGYQGIDPLPGDLSNGGAVALKFDFSPDIDQTGLYADGAMDDSGIDLRPFGIDLDGSGTGNTGQIYHVRLFYDEVGQTLREEIGVGASPSVILFAHNYNVNIPAVLGSNRAYMGFTGSTGTQNARQEIINFTYDDLTDSFNDPDIIYGTLGNDIIYVKKVGQFVDAQVNGMHYASFSSGCLRKISIIADGQDIITFDFSGGSFPSPIDIDGKNGADTLRFVGNVPSLPGNAAATGALNINGGTVNVVSDINGMDVSVNGSAQVNFSTSQHMNSLRLNGSSKGALLPDGNHFIRLSGGNIAGGATLDLADNDLIFRADAASRAAVLTAWTNLTMNGRNNGTWNGVGGITSSVAAANPNHLTGMAISLNDKGNGTPLYTSFDGEPVDVNSILVKYTYNGDSDLSGKIDADDYFNVDRGFASQLTGYSNGDFDFNGVVDADDYFLIDHAFAAQSSVLSAAKAGKLGKPAAKHSHHKRSKTTQAVVG